MKKVFILFALLAIALAFAAPLQAAVMETFDTAPIRSSYSSWTYNGFHADSCILDSLGSSTCGALPTRAVRMKQFTSGASYAQLEYVGADSLGKDGGVGVISFSYKSWANSTAKFVVSYQVNGGAYITLDSMTVAACASYQTYSRTVNDASDNIRVRIRRYSVISDRVHIDNVSITDYVAPGAETDARLAAGNVAAQTTISSLIVSEPQAQAVFSFNIRDEGTGSLPTTVTALTIGQGAGNQAANWTLYIAGATLTDGINTFTGAITASGINFSGAPLFSLPNGGAWQNWTLSVWLRTTLPYNADNKVLEFSVSPGSFTVDPAGAGFNATDPAVTSGPSNNRVDIQAVRLSITTQPPAIVYRDTDFLLRAGFTDIYGGIDADVNEAITLAVFNGTGVLSAVSGLTKTSTSGQSAWSDLRYNTVENGVVVQATSPTYPTPVLANAFNVTNVPTIVLDAYPTCWDGDTTVNALPFAVHVSVTNWIAMADSNVILKVYNGTRNPYHYTELNGWSNQTANVGYKPVIHLDATGNWSGWLALKSYGMNSFRPRVANLGNTANVTGSLITGTLLDLSDAGNGSVLEDRDGSTLSNPGEIIIVRNGSNAIVGSWIVEDNGYPLDDGGTPIVAGGWRVALCSFCNEWITYETWDPATWPGNGSPTHISRDTNFCIYPGEFVEVMDVILPVELSGNVIVKPGDGTLRLEWTTASESGNARFEIVRSGHVVGRVESAGTNPTGHSYHWTEANLENGTTYTYTLRAVSVDGTVTELATVSGTPTASGVVITEYALHQNYPNPFNPTTSIAVDLVEAGRVSLKVYNLMGQEVASLANSTMTAGRHIVSFDASSLSSGIYLYRVSVNGFSAEKKMLLMK